MERNMKGHFRDFLKRWCILEAYEKACREHPLDLPCALDTLHPCNWMSNAFCWGDTKDGISFWARKDTAWLEELHKLKRKTES